MGEIRGHLQPAVQRTGQPVKVGVSACLMGERCRYDGKSEANPAVQAFLKDHDCILVCPECEGGLSCPRVPCELKNGRVIGRDGMDYTVAYERGAQRCLEKVKDCDLVILQPRSPSCGATQVHDGSFSGELVPGQGIFAARLKESNIPVLEADAF